MSSGASRSEPKSSPAARHIEQEAFLRIQKTADELMGDLAELLKPHGISPTQYNVLRILRGAGAGCCGGGHPDPARRAWLATRSPVGCSPATRT